MKKGDIYKALRIRIAELKSENDELKKQVKETKFVLKKIKEVLMISIKGE